MHKVKTGSPSFDLNMACRGERLSANFPDMKKASEHDEGEACLRRCFEYEATHEIAFASSRALLDARLIAEITRLVPVVRAFLGSEPPAQTRPQE